MIKDPGNYEVGRVYVWTTPSGTFAHLNGKETTVISKVELITINRELQLGWATDTVFSEDGISYRAYAQKGDLRPKNEPPKGEQIIRDMFLPKTDDACDKDALVLNAQ